MPLKMDKKGRYVLRIDREGIPRKYKTFPGTDVGKIEGEIYEREYLAKYKAEQDENLDKRTLRELIDSWYIYHGINLSDGKRRKTKLLYLCADLKNPVASKLTAEDFVQYRYKKTVTNDILISQKTFNNLHGYLGAVFNKLKKLHVIDYDNPISGVDFIKIQERQMSYLNRPQLDTLFESISTGCKNKSTWYVSQICIRTGARWSEAEKLKRKQLHNNMITFEFTKGKKTRSVPICPVFYKQILEFSGNKNPDDRLFDNCISAFRRAVYRTDLIFPTGQMTHILRHSFASSVAMRGGNIVTLQKILGHADIQQTMVYAHLFPDHLNHAVLFNPMAE